MVARWVDFKRKLAVITNICITLQIRRVSLCIPERLTKFLMTSNDSIGLWLLSRHIARLTHGKRNSRTPLERPGFSPTK